VEHVLKSRRSYDTCLHRGRIGAEKALSERLSKRLSGRAGTGFSTYLALQSVSRDYALTVRRPRDPSDPGTHLRITSNTIPWPRIERGEVEFLAHFASESGDLKRYLRLRGHLHGEWSTPIEEQLLPIQFHVWFPYNTGFPAKLRPVPGFDFQSEKEGYEAAFTAHCRLTSATPEERRLIELVELGMWLDDPSAEMYGYERDMQILTKKIKELERENEGLRTGFPERREVNMEDGIEERCVKEEEPEMEDGVWIKPEEEIEEGIRIKTEE
jgi:hypothetical protein